jgi:hypothetical protein
MNCLATNANMMFDEKSLELMYKIFSQEAEVPLHLKCLKNGIPFS